MKRKEVTKTFMMISNWKNHLVSMFMQTYFSAVRVSTPTPPTVLSRWHILYGAGFVTCMYRAQIPTRLDGGHRVFVCFKPFKDMDCAVRPKVMCVTKKHWHISKRVGHSHDFELLPVTTLSQSAEPYTNSHSVANPNPFFYMASSCYR